MANQAGCWLRNKIGGDGVMYHGWAIRSKWNAVKGYIEFVATNPDYPGVEIKDSAEHRVKWAIDRRERVMAGEAT